MSENPSCKVSASQTSNHANRPHRKLKMKHRTFFSLCAKFGCLLALGACSPKIVDAGAATVPHTLSTLKTADNRPASVYLKKDKPTLIKFWASWCPLCLSELGQTEKWAQDAKFSSANLITVASPGFLHEKKDGDFQKWYAGLNYPKLPVVTDNGGTIAQSLNISVYPSWALIGKNGDVQRIVKGSINEAQALALIRDPNADLGSLKHSFYKPDTQKKDSKIMNTRTIYLAGGCFWGLEAYFQRIDAWLTRYPGYANGNTKNPSYEDVSYRHTGH
ncbi:peptide methionine sulfoxide reductase msrA/msrB domain protein, partial [Neisseria meningitidis OX99.30304]